MIRRNPAPGRVIPEGSDRVGCLVQSLFRAMAADLVPLAFVPGTQVWAMRPHRVLDWQAVGDSVRLY